MFNERSVLDLYQGRKISLQKAASLLGCDIWEMLEIIRRVDIPIDYSREELSEDLAFFAKGSFTYPGRDNDHT